MAEASEREDTSIVFTEVEEPEPVTTVTEESRLDAGGAGGVEAEACEAARGRRPNESPADVRKAALRRMQYSV